MTVRIDPALAGLVVPLGSVEPHPRNVRRGDVEMIRSSLREFGQVRPILVQASTGFIVAGNHTWRAMQEEAATDVAAVKIDISDDDALRYLLADNRTNDVASYDDAGLLAVLEELQAGDLLLGTGYDLDAIEDLQAQLDAIPETTYGGEQREHAQGDAQGVPYDPENPRVPLREIVLLFPVDQAEEFAENVRALMQRYGVSTVVDTVSRAVADAVHADA